MDEEKLRLMGHVGNYRRAKRSAAKRAASISKQAELEIMFATLQKRLKRALGEIETNGEVISVPRFSSKGVPYSLTIPNPWLRVAQRTEVQLVALAKQLGQYSQPGAPPPSGSGRQMFPDLYDEKPEVPS